MGMWNQLDRFVVQLATRFSLVDEGGQAMVEYALIVATISIAAIAFFTPIGSAISTAFSTVSSAM
jgi:Flp pilus assembly pilin Flp